MLDRNCARQKKDYWWKYKLSGHSNLVWVWVIRLPLTPSPSRLRLPFLPVVWSSLWASFTYDGRSACSCWAPCIVCLCFPIAGPVLGGVRETGLTGSTWPMLKFQWIPWQQNFQQHHFLQFCLVLFSSFCILLLKHAPNTVHSIQTPAHIPPHLIFITIVLSLNKYHCKPWLLCVCLPFFDAACEPPPHDGSGEDPGPASSPLTRSWQTSSSILSLKTRHAADGSICFTFRAKYGHENQCIRNMCRAHKRQVKVCRRGSL